jgi:hypothetical protein
MDMVENLLAKRKRNEGSECGGGNVAQEGKGRGKRNGGDVKRGKGLKERDRGTLLLFLCHVGIGEGQREKSGRSSGDGGTWE